jgi:hypothetical protein
MLLHPVRGLNPHLACCSRCGKENGEVVLLGANDRKYECRDCGALNLGRATCGYCGSTRTQDVGVIVEHERIPTGFCEDCRKAVELHAKIVADGGVYFACEDCGTSGVIPPSRFASAIRHRAGISPPKPVGVKLNAAGCPVCKAKGSEAA